MAITSELRLLRRNKNMRNYVMKLLFETKKNRNYVTLWRIRHQEVKIGGFILWKIPFDGCFACFIQLKITRNYVPFHFQKWLLRVTRNST
jgi:hypothetical protein